MKNSSSIQLNEINQKEFSLKLIYPLLLVIFLFVCEVMFCYPGYIAIFGFPIYITVPVVEIFFLVKSIYLIFKKNYSKSISYLVCLPVMIFLFGFPPVYVVQANFVSSYIKLLVNEQKFLSKIATVKPDAYGFRYAEFREDLDAPIIVYDESNNIESKEIEKVGVFWSRWGKSADSNRACVAVVRKLKTHFYFVITNSEVC